MNYGRRESTPLGVSSTGTDSRGGGGGRAVRGGGMRQQTIIFPHRVYREPGFLCSRPNWVPPPPLGSWGGGETHSLAGKGVGDNIQTTRQKLWYSV
jgi:hypothetical protein